jgi:hypothetical protein
MSWDILLFSEMEAENQCEQKGVKDDEFCWSN